ncbi:PfaD family polyunsaturated fatty acid/polyketide biosynthesis protein [Streptomyces albogriseolus]|uniref:PfaD family polyunsaturated fatty acid/polyketide biosynthesis protein n=1 Tax=Streptomyces albogriseolus TaxID=1887 RepID=UPI002258D73F|nr:PfaD family polyunsaturated fatty acid/polyketide biosynthesis protein [Streptomyces viridodiastaticus]MCX4571434.1 PfaD family polyunsaturated fatty acid/polyketide biosynthesis protein [Streptomyces viridodiastaticus]
MTTAPARTTTPPVHTDPAGIHRVLGALEQPCYIVDTGQGVGAANAAPGPGGRIVAAVGPLPPERLGCSAFRARHGVGHAYMAGAMAGGIASEELVIALARAGVLASFGAAGLLPGRIDRALTRFAAEIPALPYAVNLIHSPSEDALEREGVELLLRHRVRCVEASAFMDLTPHVVRYRVAGLSRTPDGRVHVGHRIVAKVSRAEVAERFMRPAPEAITADLVARGLITAEQAELARRVPMADDVTAEADSGGHTDRRPLTALFPGLLRVRDTVQRELGYGQRIGLGAAGGIGTPRAAAAAFALGADYVVVGSVHQSCLESGTSDAARRLLAGAGLADFEMAPAADMFELGVELQVLKKGTLFPMRAKKLYELYKAYDGVEALPEEARGQLERQVFRRPLDDVWADVEEYFTRRDPDQLLRARQSPRRRMALVFRWYLGMASRWAVTGEGERTADYQVWCGPAMGGFNEWVRGSYLAALENRRAADVAHHLMRGAAFTARVQQLAWNGVRLPAACTEYVPVPPGEAR